MAKISDTSLEKANELIDIGAVWARMDTLTEEEILAQYDEDDFQAESHLDLLLFRVADLRDVGQRGAQ